MASGPLNYKALFLISLAVNIGLGIYAFSKVSPAVEPVVAPPAPRAGPTIPKPPPRLEPAMTSTVSKPFGWQSVESSDYREYIANLRSVGCPEETIRDIIRADVTKLYEQKKKQLRKESPQFQYWKGDAFFRGAGRDAWIKMLALDEERDGVLRALGVEPDYSKQMAKKVNGLEWMLDFLGDDKKAQILRLNKELEDRLAVRTENLEQSALESLIKEKDAAVRRLLTPEEALLYDLRMSSTAARLRSQLGAFEPTEEEFISLYKLQTAFDEKQSATNPAETAGDRPAKSEAADMAFQHRVLEALGTDRYADYEMALDPSFQQVYVAAKQAQLGIPEAKHLYQIRKSAEERAARIQADQALAPAQRAAALEGIRVESETAISGVLGDKMWEQSSRGLVRWLDSIHQRKAPSGSP